MRRWSPNVGWAALGSAMSVGSIAFGLAIGSWLAPQDATSRARDIGAALSLDAPADAAWQEVPLQRPEILAEQRTQRREESRTPCADETAIHLDDALPPGLLAATEIRPGDIDLPLPPGLHSERSASLRLRDLDAALPSGLDEPASRRASPPSPPSADDRRSTSPGAVTDPRARARRTRAVPSRASARACARARFIDTPAAVLSLGRCSGRRTGPRPPWPRASRRHVD